MVESSWLSAAPDFSHLSEPSILSTSACMARPGVAGTVVHHFDCVCRGIPLDVQRLRGLLRGEVAGVGVKEVVVGLP